MKTNMITSGAIGLALAGLLFAGCSDTQSNDLSQYDATGERAAVQTQAGVPVLHDTELSENDAVDDISEPEIADYDFSDAQVADVSYQQLNEWMDEVTVTLRDSMANADADNRDGLEELTDRAEDVSEDLAAIDDQDLNQPADPEMVKDVLEVQVEVGEYAENL